jgi:hypothetical protein
MYTEEDLRATLDALEQEAPDEGSVLAGLGRARRRRTVRRRTTRVIAAAVAAAVVLGGAIVVPQLVSQSDQVAVSPHFERWRFPFAVEDIPGYRVSYQSASSARISVGDTELYELTILQKGQYDRLALQVGEPVDVRGKPGFYRVGMYGKESMPNVVWEYAPDSLAQMVNASGTTPADAREAVLRVAGAVRFDRTAPLRVPFLVGYLPAGLQAVAPSSERDIELVGGIGATVAMAGRAGSLTISAGHFMATASLTPIDPGRPVATSDSRTGMPVVAISFGQLGVRLTGAGISTDELKKIARSITPVADPYDEATWVDADKAIPLH